MIDHQNLPVGSGHGEPSATGAEDAGVFTTSHNKHVDGRADFGSFTVG